MLDWLKRFFLLGLLLTTTMTLDIIAYFALAHQLLFFLVSTLIVLFWYRPSLNLLTLAPLFLAAQSLIIYETTWWPLLLAFAAIALCLFLKPQVYSTPLYPLLLGLGYIGIILFLDPHSESSQTAMPYTIGIVFANLILISIFSLKLQTSKTGQSLTTLT